MSRARSSNFIRAGAKVVPSMTPLLQNILADDAGNSSSMLAVLLCSTVMILGVWACVSIQTRTLQEIPHGVQFFFATAIGGKVIQKFRENVSEVNTRVVNHQDTKTQNQTKLTEANEGNQG